MRRLNIIKLLSRSDKWYLGSGGPLVWTPPFPLWLDRLGFWDSPTWYDCDLGPAFTVTLLADSSDEVQLSLKGREWNPAYLKQWYEGGGKGSTFKIRVVERKSVLDDGQLVAEVSLRNLSSKRLVLHTIVWTVQKDFPEEKEYIAGAQARGHSLLYTQHVGRGTRSPMSLLHQIQIDQPSDSHAIVHTEASPMQPCWELTPLRERFQGGRFSHSARLLADARGFVYLAIHRRVLLRPSENITLCVISLVKSFQGEEQTVHGMAVSLPSKTPPTKSLAGAQLQSPTTLSLSAWRDFFSSVPYFECSDEYTTRYYWYRWFGLKLFSMRAGGGNYMHPFISEGPRYFRGAISYSAQCHMLETRWLPTPVFAQGSLENFIDHQKSDGSFWGYIRHDGYYESSFYHANWGKAALEVDRIYHDEAFLSRIYDGLKRYAEYFDRERDRERSGLYDVVNHFETGQEFSRRYLVVDAKADSENWGTVFRMKGVDATVYLYELKKALGEIAQRLGKSPEEQQSWFDGAEQIKNAILRRMWDPEEEMFFDVNPLTLKRTGVKAATCFYPYMTDLVDESHLSGLKRHLFDPNEFWTPFPVPSMSASDPMFSAEGEWKGRRMNCPWNGRVWPMTNSHVAEAVAQSAIRFRDSELRAMAVELISRFIRMLFFYGDPKRPNSFEHYHPFLGTPSVYRGVDDYQHSWVVDLIIKYVAGLRPQKDQVVVDPFPFRLSSLVLENAQVGGSRFKVQRVGKKFSVLINGKKVGASIVGEPIILKLY
jgi:hypothetical protein